MSVPRSVSQQTVKKMARLWKDTAIWHPSPVLCVGMPRNHGCHQIEPESGGASLLILTVLWLPKSSGRLKGIRPLSRWLLGRQSLPSRNFWECAYNILEIKMFSWFESLQLSFLILFKNPAKERNHPLFLSFRDAPNLDCGEETKPQRSPFPYSGHILE